MPLGAGAIATIAGGALTTGTGIFQSIGASKRAKKAQKAIDEYQRQDLTNPYANLQVSTLGSDLQREDLARSMASFSQNAALGGGRAIVGLMPNALEQQFQAEQKIAADLDQQYNQNQQLKAQGDAMVQQMIEARENADLAGLGNAENVARQETANGFNNIAQGAMGVLSAAAGGVFDKKPKTPDTAGGGGGNFNINGSAPTVPFGVATNPIQNSPFVQQNPTYLNTKNGGVTTPGWLNLLPKNLYRGY